MAESASKEEKKEGMLKRLLKFPSVFWIVQTFELMERGAYYTMVPIIVYYAQYNIGVPVWLAVNITAFMYPLQYGLPILSGALAEKMGFRRQMIFAFSVLFIAYLFLSFAGNSIMLILGVMMIGFGVGSYKPLISATIAKCTPQNDRNLAYAAYYWVVNLAAAVFPIVFVILEFLDVLTQSQYEWIFRISAVFFLVNLLTAIFFFKEVPRTGAVKTVGDALRNIKTAMSDKKFLVMVFLMAGFWALYSTTLNALPSALFNFKLVPAWFTVMILAIPNPATIILMGPLLTKFMDKLESLVTLMTGVFLYTLGMITIGFFGISLNWTFVIIGIIIASVGEFLAAPGYYAFVSKLAPKEKVSAYLGTNFLSSSTGLVGGTLVFGTLYTVIGTMFGRPKFFYGILIACGFLLLVGYMIYYRSWGQDIIERAKRIREQEEGVTHEAKKADDPLSRTLTKMFTHGKTKYVALALIPLVLIATFSMGKDVYYPPDTGDGGDGGVEVRWEQQTQTISFSGYSAEGGTTEESFGAQEGLKWINLTLTWTDEAVRIPLQNRPDSMQVSLFAPNSSEPEETSGPSSEGRLTISYEAPEDEALDGQWRVVVGCTEADDIYGPAGILVRSQDDGNEWDVTVQATFLVKVEEPSGQG